MKLYYVTNVLDLQRFETETTTVLDFFEICMEIFFFLNETNIATSLLIIDLKCIVVLLLLI